MGSGYNTRSKSSFRQQRTIILHETEEDIVGGAPPRHAHKKVDKDERDERNILRKGTKHGRIAKEKSERGSKALMKKGTREKELSEKEDCQTKEDFQAREDVIPIEISSSQEEETAPASRAGAGSDEKSAKAPSNQEEIVPAISTRALEISNSKAFETPQVEDLVLDEASDTHGLMQAAVTEKLLENLWNYLGVELNFSDVREKVISCIVTKRKSRNREDQFLQLVKDHVHAYARALLLYRRDHCLAYTDGSDKTSLEPLCVFPPRNGLFLHLKEAYNLPTVLPQSLKVKKRNDLLLAFRCFTPMSNTASVYYPALRSNEELISLPGFAEKFRSDVGEETDTCNKEEGRFLWKCMRERPEEQRFEVRNFPTLRMKSLDGFISREEYKIFWEEFIRTR